MFVRCFVKNCQLIRRLLGEGGQTHRHIWDLFMVYTTGYDVIGHSEDFLPAFGTGVPVRLVTLD
jgi:hypothetical protein